MSGGILLGLLERSLVGCNLALSLRSLLHCLVVFTDGGLGFFLCVPSKVPVTVDDPLKLEHHGVDPIYCFQNLMTDFPTLIAIESSIVSARLF